MKCGQMRYEEDWCWWSGNRLVGGEQVRFVESSDKRQQRGEQTDGGEGRRMMPVGLHWGYIYPRVGTYPKASALPATSCHQKS